MGVYRITFDGSATRKAIAPKFGMAKKKYIIVRPKNLTAKTTSPKMSRIWITHPESQQVWTDITNVTTVTTNVLNGLSVASFGGSQYLGRTFGTAITMDITNLGLFMAIKRPNSSIEAVDLGYAGTTNGSGTDRIATHLRWVDGNAYFDLGGSDSASRLSGSTTAFADGNWKIVSARRLGTNGVARANGTQQLSSTSLSTGATKSLLYSTVGAWYNSANSLPNGSQMAEFFVAQGTALSDAQMFAAEGYLAWKLGLQGDLAAGHAHKNAAPLVNIVAF